MAYSGGVSRGLGASSDGSASTSSRNQPFQFRSPWLFAGRTVLSSSCDVICPVSPLCVHSISAQVRLSRRTCLLSRPLSFPAPPCCCCALRVYVQTVRPRPAFSCPVLLSSPWWPQRTAPVLTASFCSDPGCGVRRSSSCLDLLTDWLCGDRILSPLLV